jgi:hypothetical protein
MPIFEFHAGAARGVTVHGFGQLPSALLSHCSIGSAGMPAWGRVFSMASEDETKGFALVVPRFVAEKAS